MSRLLYPFDMLKSSDSAYFLFSAGSLKTDVLCSCNAPILKSELELVNTDDYTVIVADGATSAPLDSKIIPGIIGLILMEMSKE
ncbi:MAG: hypothetical protein R2741_13170 [Methanolobus sp.]